MSKFKAEDKNNLDNIVTRHRMLLDSYSQSMIDAAVAGKLSLTEMEEMCGVFIDCMEAINKEGVKLALEAIAVDTDDMLKAVETMHREWGLAWSRVSGARSVLAGLALNESSKINAMQFMD